MRLAPPKEPPQEVSNLLDDLEKRRGFLPESMRLMSHRPDVLKAFLNLGAAVMGPSDAVPVSLKRMIAYVTSLSAGCRYCQAHNARLSSLEGVDDEKVAELWLFESSPHFTDAERVALRVALLAGQTPNLVEDQDTAAVVEAYGPQGLAEITAVIAYFGFLNRWNDTLATPLEDAPTLFATETLRPAGWTVGKHGGEA